jgi:hypothetical protein
MNASLAQVQSISFILFFLVNCLKAKDLISRKPGVSSWGLSQYPIPTWPNIPRSFLVLKSQLYYQMEVERHNQEALLTQQHHCLGSYFMGILNTGPTQPSDWLYLLWRSAYCSLTTVTPPLKLLGHCICSFVIFKYNTVSKWWKDPISVICYEGTILSPWAPDPVLNSQVQDPGLDYQATNGHHEFHSKAHYCSLFPTKFNQSI